MILTMILLKRKIIKQLILKREHKDYEKNDEAKHSTFTIYYVL